MRPSRATMSVAWPSGARISRGCPALSAGQEDLVATSCARQSFPACPQGQGAQCAIAVLSIRGRRQCPAARQLTAGAPRLTCPQVVTATAGVPAQSSGLRYLLLDIIDLPREPVARLPRGVGRSHKHDLKKKHTKQNKTTIPEFWRVLLHSPSVCTWRHTRRSMTDDAPHAH